MGNALRDEVEVLLDGKKRFLRYTNNAIVQLEEALGTSKRALLGKMQRAALDAQAIAEDPERTVYLDTYDVPMRQLRALLWAGLIHEDPTLTLEEVGDLMDKPPVEAMFGEMYFLAAASEAFFVHSLPGYRTDKETRERAANYRRILLNGASTSGEPSDESPSREASPKTVSGD
jgi:hypothetical protein